jgi:hypothetical protein
MIVIRVVDVYPGEVCGGVVIERVAIGDLTYRRRGMPWRWREWMP